MDDSLTSSIVHRPSSLSLSTHLLVLGGFLALTLIFTYPIVLHFTSQIPFGGDAWQHIWNLWWVKHALLDLHTSPYQTDLLFYPDGANLYFHTLVLTAGLIGIPLQLLGFNLLETYNLVMMSGFLLAGYGAFLLCHYLTRNVWASFVGGFVFAFSPYHFAHLIGHMNLSSLQWIPFYVLLLLRAADAPRVSSFKFQVSSFRQPGLLWAAGAGVLLAINTYTDWLYGIFLILFTGLFLAWRILMPSERRRVREEGVSWWDLGLRFVVGFGLFLLLVSPVLFPTLQEAQKGYAQQPPLETMVYSSDLLLAFLPSYLHPLWGKFLLEHIPPRNLAEQTVFLGYVTLGLAAFTAWKLRRDSRVLFWAFAAFATWVLSLGPVLQVMGRSRFTDFDVAIPLPYLLLYKLPLLNIMRTPGRLTVLTMLALGVLVAFGLTYLSQSKARRSRESGVGSRESGISTDPLLLAPYSLLPRLRSVWLIVLPLLIAFEYLAVPFPTVPPGWGVPIYAKVASEPGRFALLELPIRPFSDYMAYQTQHGKPIVGGYLSRQPPYPTFDKTPALKYLLNTVKPGDPMKGLVMDGKGVEALRDLGVKYLIIRWWAFTPEEKAAMEAKLDTLLGRPPDLSYPGDMVDVWEIK